MSLDTLANIEEKWLIEPTGDPFADTGGLVIQFWKELYPDKNILQLIEFVAKIYVNNWKGNLYPYFLNSTITNSAFKGKEIVKTLEYFTGILNNVNHVQGFCRISGRNTQLFSAGRGNHILSGSGAFINFHHGYEEGLFLSKEVLIRMFFVPLGVIQLYDKIALLQSNQIVVSDFFIRNIVKENIKNIANGLSEGSLKSQFHYPSNALFGFADECIANLSIATYNQETETSSIKNVSLSLYHFTNFGAKPDIELYRLPATVFMFYAHCKKYYRKDWDKFVKYHYKSSKFKNAHFNENTNNWENDKESASYETYKIWKNNILEKLLEGNSILTYFLKWSKTQRIDFKIIEIYQINLRNMEQKTLHKIRELADFSVQNRDVDSIKKAITRLNGMKSSFDIRQFLLKLIAQNYGEGNQKPLITLDEFVQYLFPDGANWRDIRDLLLIAIYQKLHESQIAVEIENNTEDDDETTTTNP